MALDGKVLEVIAKGLGLESADPAAVSAKLAELGVPEGKIFTQTDVNAIMAENKKGLRKEKDELAKSLEAIRREVADLKAGNGSGGSTDGGTAFDDELDDKTTPPAAAPDAKVIHAELKRLKARQRVTEESVSEWRKKAETAEQVALEREGDRLFVSAATKAGFLDPEGEALPLYRRRLKFEDSKWVLYDDENDPAETIEAGLTEILSKRPHLARAKSSGGGGGGGGPQSDPVKQLTADYEAAAKLVDTNPRNAGYLTRMHDAKRKLDAAQRGHKKQQG